MCARKVVRSRVGEGTPETSFGAIGLRCCLSVCYASATRNEICGEVGSAGRADPHHDARRVRNVVGDPINSLYLRGSFVCWQLATTRIIRVRR